MSTPGQDSPVVSLFKVFESSENINELTEALSQAQGEFPPIPKDSEVAVKNKEGRLLYTYKYADLTTIIDKTRPSLTKSGLSFTQDYFKHPHLGVGIATLIFHKSGQWLKTGFVPCPIQSNDMKQVAGQFTYGKRISLTAALGVSADEDVDAGPLEPENETTKLPPKSNEPPQPTPRRPVDDLLDIVKELGISNHLVPQIIKMVTGEARKSTELAPMEIDQVVQYIRDTYGRDPR